MPFNTDTLLKLKKNPVPTLKEGKKNPTTTLLLISRLGEACSPQHLPAGCGTRQRYHPGPHWRWRGRRAPRANPCCRKYPEPPSSIIPTPSVSWAGQTPLTFAELHSAKSRCSWNAHSCPRRGDPISALGSHNFTSSIFLHAV